MNITKRELCVQISNGKDAGTESKMLVSKDEAGNATKRSYIKFDTTGTTLEGISKATLRIYCEKNSSDASVIGLRDVNLYAVSPDWSELSFDWKTQPDVIGKIADLDTSSYKGDRWIEIDVTAYVNAYLGQPIAFAIWDEGGDSSSGLLQFSTREIRRKEPQLVLVAGEPGEISTPAVSTTIIAAADTYVQQNSTDEFGTAANLRIKSDDSKGLTRQAYVKFDLSEVTAAASNRATLRLYCLYASDLKSEINARDYKLYAVSSSWDELGMTWATQPEREAKVADIDTTKAKKGVWIEIDVTDYVNAHMGEVVAFVICNEGVASNENHINLGSREVTGQEPQLVIE